MVVHGLAQAGAVLAVSLPATLLSAPAAASWAGVGWWRAMVQAACAAHPDTPCLNVLDCGAAPGRAMEALRAGQALLVLDPACPAFTRVASVAAGLGARVLTARPPALDLACPGAARALPAWLHQAGAGDDDSRAALG